MATTSIEWATDVWNPVAGCTWASAGCDHCYAATMTRRLEAMGKADYTGLTTHKHFNGTVRTLPDKLTIPLRWKKPRTIFVNSMSDLFHADVPFDFIDRVFAVMALTPQHTYQVLTKRPERMAEYFNERYQATTVLSPPTGELLDDREQYVKEAGRQMLLGKLGDDERFWNADGSSTITTTPWPLPNVWLGTSVEDQQRADERIPHLLRCPAVVRFLSVEPMLSEIDLHFGDNMKPDEDSSVGWMPCDAGGVRHQHPITSPCNRGGIHWVICGGESGHHARPMHSLWPLFLCEECVGAGVPFFFKQWGEWAPLPDDAYPNHHVEGDQLDVHITRGGITFAAGARRIRVETR